MKELNRIRMAAGLVIDPSIELTETVKITEARDAPRRKSDLRQTDAKSLKAKKRGLEQATKHVQAAVDALERIPATDFSGDVPRFIGELEDLLDTGGGSGMESYLEMIASELRKIEGNEKQAKRKEEEEERYADLEAQQKEEAFNAEVENDRKAAEMHAAKMKTEEEDTFINQFSDVQRTQIDQIIDTIRTLVIDNMFTESCDANKELTDLVGSDKIAEAMHYYNVQYNGSHEEAGDKPINVSDGSSNDEQVMDTLSPTKNESPAQLKTMDQQDNSPQDKSGDDLSNKFKVPNGIKQALKTEIDKAKKEAESLDVRDKDASYFYKDLAKAFEDLLGHLEKGTVYDMKQAQSFAQTLMGPMLHKIPTEVWKFLTNGGETRSLKSYMQEVPKKYPITGPRNTLK